MNTTTTRTSGARKCTTASALTGTISSLVSDLMPSATGCRIPYGPVRFGPMRFCMRPRPLRSKTVVSANNAGNTHMIATTLSSTPTNGCSTSGKSPITQCLRRTKI